LEAKKKKKFCEVWYGDDGDGRTADGDDGFAGGVAGPWRVSG
jgi:hypothetical protein